ncbi:MAG: tryptophan--tRNA ligase, partial [Planctomycetes bacterium RBG_16_43_13]
MAKKRVLSGMRPTGMLHIGHYFGALRNWVTLQDEYDCFYMIADWHAVMSEYKDTSRITEYTRENVADWIACGVDPKKSTIFVQSAIPEHAELHLALSCITPLGWLERCPTYKEQIRELANKDVSNYAFLGYPVLQASDILLYKGDAVPVGEDQLPHLELTREIVRRFNSLFGAVFPEPQAKLTEVPRILGSDGRKMSKSYGNAIELCEKVAEIKKKVMSMFTDPARIRRTDLGHPDRCNVFSYHNLFSEKNRVGEIKVECSTAKIGCTECKGELAERLNTFLTPIREKRNNILETKGLLD